MLEAGDPLEELPDLLGAQNDGEFLSLPGRRDALDDPVLGERDPVEQAEGADGLTVVTPGGVLLLDEEEEIGSDVGRVEAFGDLPKYLAKVATRST